jgi:hypothetical protein
MVDDLLIACCRLEGGETLMSEASYSDVALVYIISGELTMLQVDTSLYYRNCVLVHFAQIMPSFFSSYRFLTWYLAELKGKLLCCGSGSGIRCLFDPWIRDPGWVKKLGSGSGMNDPDHISESLETIFWFKIFKFFDEDPGSEMEKIWIRDGKNSDPGWKNSDPG